MRYSMKSSIKALLLLTLIAGMPTQQVSAQTTNYASNRFGEINFSFDYPSKLELKEMAPNMAAVIFNYGPLATYTVSVQDLRDWNVGRKDLDGYIVEYEKRILPMLVGMERTKKERVKFAGQDAYLTVYTAAQKADPKHKTKYLMYTFVVDGVFAFDVGYAADPEAYDTFLAEAQKILASFKLSRIAAGKLKTYTNNLMGFSVDHPGSWKLKVVPRSLITRMTNHKGESALVTITNDEDDVPEGVALDTITIGIKDLRSTPVSLSEYRDWDHEESGKAFKDYVKKGGGADKIAGRECYFKVVERSGLRCKTYVFIDRKTSFALSFNTRPERFEKALPAAEKIMKSFRFTRER